MDDNSILGMLRITENGLCDISKELDINKKKFDPQIIAGFFYALDKFIKDYLGEDIYEIRTQNFKILFKKLDNEILVHIVDIKFDTKQGLGVLSQNNVQYLFAKIADSV